MKDHSKLIGRVLNEQIVDLDMKDTLLYALSLGFGADPLDTNQLRYVYETNTLSLPGMAMIVGYPGFWMKEAEYGFEWQKALHAEESITIHRRQNICKNYSRRCSRSRLRERLFCIYEKRALHQR
jgi:hypothetical protein